MPTMFWPKYARIALPIIATNLSTFAASSNSNLSYIFFSSNKERERGEGNMGYEGNGGEGNKMGVSLSH
jgi:hypothetical protein